MVWKPTGAISDIISYLICNTVSPLCGSAPYLIRKVCHFRDHFVWNFIGIQCSKIRFLKNQILFVQELPFKLIAAMLLHVTLYKILMQEYSQLEVQWVYSCSAHCRPTVKQYSVPTVRAVHMFHFLRTPLYRWHAVHVQCPTVGALNSHCTPTALRAGFIWNDLWNGTSRLSYLCPERGG